MSEFMEMAEACRSLSGMADPLDQAGVIAQLERDHGVSAIRAQLQGEGQDDCEECGCDIPHARRQAMPSAIRCAPCQEAVEAKGRVWRG